MSTRWRVIIPITFASSDDVEADVIGSALQTAAYIAVGGALPVRRIDRHEHEHVTRILTRQQNVTAPPSALRIHLEKHGVPSNGRVSNHHSNSEVNSNVPGLNALH